MIYPRRVKSSQAHAAPGVAGRQRLDAALHALGRERGPDVFVVNIGALDGVSFDGTEYYIRRYGWRGLFVEPVLELYQRLRVFYRDRDDMRFERAAIADSDGETTMMRIAPAIVDAGDVDYGFLGMSSLLPVRNGLKSDAARDVVERHAERITVPCMTVSTLLEKHAVEAIDVLHIDVEGYDWMVLRQFDLVRYQPAVVRIEQLNLAAEETAAARAFLAHAGLEVVEAYDELLGLR